MDDDLLWGTPCYGPQLTGAAESVACTDEPRRCDGRMPALYLGHGAPPLLDDPVWMSELAAWSRDLPRPQAILMVSAHWQTAPLAIGATRDRPARLRLLRLPPALLPGPTLRRRARARRQVRLLARDEPVASSRRGLDHGAWVPLLAMYPEADIPVLQMSMPDLDPAHLFEVGRRLRPCATRACSSSAPGS